MVRLFPADGLQQAVPSHTTPLSGFQSKAPNGALELPRDAGLEVGIHQIITGVQSFFPNKYS
jgi:hypothetical protein